jgi:hypothetical protein
MTAVQQGDSTQDSASTRGEAARARADELRQRRADLVRGIPSTAQTAETARLRAQQSLERAESANRAAAARHTDAGQAHRAAAAVHEQAAIRAGDGSGEAHQDAAEKHRVAAAQHDAAAHQKPHTWRAPKA